MECHFQYLKIAFVITHFQIDCLNVEMSFFYQNLNENPLSIGMNDEKLHFVDNC